MVISASLQACGVVFPFAMLTSICRSIVTICSGLYLLIGMSRFSSKWILSHSTWYKSCRSGQDQPKLLMQGGFRILFGRRPSYLMLGTQPLPQPPTSMSFYSSVGSADWPKTEIVSPPNHHVIECLYHCFLVQKGLIPSSLLADRLTNALHPFLRRNGT